MSPISEWISALAALGCLAFSVFALLRGDRSKLADQVSENTEDISHIEGHLEATSDYRPRPR